MDCIKCGKQVQGTNVFCQDCLLEMGKYPILPGTVVHLPTRKEYTAPKKISKRHVPTAEEQVTFLRKWLIAQTLFLLLCIAAIVLMVNPTLHYIHHTHFEIGQNYTSVTPTAPSSAEQP